MRRLLTIAGAAAALGLTAAGCGWNDDVDSRAATAGLPSTRADVEAHEWLLDREDSSLTVDDDNPVTLAVTGDTASGRAPCNTYRGGVDLGADDSVEIGPLALTRMACPGSAMDAESEYVEALEAVDHVEVDVDEDGRDDQDRLVLTGDDVRLSFRSFDADELLVGTWTVVGVATGDAVESVLAGTEPTVTFAEGGDLSVEPGCNTGGGDWELDGDELTIGAVRLTMMACDDPAGVMEQETAIVAALEAVARIELAPGSLTMLDDDGAILLVATEE
jgi:heat shock protein HslJ